MTFSNETYFPVQMRVYYKLVQRGLLLTHVGAKQPTADYKYGLFRIYYQLQFPAFICSRTMYTSYNMSKGLQWSWTWSSLYSNILLRMLNQVPKSHKVIEKKKVCDILPTASAHRITRKIPEQSYKVLYKEERLSILSRAGNGRKPIEAEAIG